MTNKHTPGPWKLELIDKWPFGIRITGANGDEVMNQEARAHSTRQKSRRDCENGVGFVGDNEFARESAIRAIATQDANARLIAAAPETAAERDRLKEINAELMAALERTLSWLTSYPGGGTMWPSGPYEQARAAIAKATGQAMQDMANSKKEIG